MKTTVYVAGIVLVLAGFASLLFGARDLNAALLMCAGSLTSTFGGIWVGRSRRALVSDLFIVAFFAGYLVYAAITASGPLLAFQALRSAWLCIPLMIAVASYAIFAIQRHAKSG
jgi:hypothetical protein